MIFRILTYHYLCVYLLQYKQCKQETALNGSIWHYFNFDLQINLLTLKERSNVT